MKKIKKYTKITVGLIITVVLMWYAVKDVSLEEIVHNVSQANHIYLIPIMLVMGLFFYIKILRWRYLLSPIGDYKVKDITAPLMIGFLGNNLLPLRLGEIVRVICFCRKFNVAKGSVFSTLVLERILDIFSILVLLLFGIWASPALPAWCKDVGYGMGGAVFVLSSLSFVYVVWNEKFIAFFEKYFVFLPEKMFKAISHTIEKGADGLHSMKNLNVFAINIALSLFEWFLMIIVIDLSLCAFSVETPFSACFIVNGITAFGAALPSSPGFFGVIEAIFSKTLGIFGVEQVKAVSVAIYFHLCSYIPVNIVGFYYLQKMGLSLSEVSEEAETEIEEDAAMVN